MRQFLNLNRSLPRLLEAKRILVLGSSGSGKTTFTRQLSSMLGIEPIHLDAQFWRPGWISTPQNEWREVVSELVRRDSWVMDGTYESTLDLRIPAADCLIMINQSRFTCLWRVLKRKATIDDERRPDAPAGQPIDRPFLRYVWNYRKLTEPVVRERIRQFGPHKTLITLKGSRGVAECLCKVEHGLRWQASQVNERGPDERVDR